MSSTVNISIRKIFLYSTSVSLGSQNAEILPSFVYRHFILHDTDSVKYGQIPMLLRHYTNKYNLAKPFQWGFTLKEMNSLVREQTLSIKTFNPHRSLERM